MSIPKHYLFIKIKAVRIKILINEKHQGKYQGKQREILISSRTIARTILALSLAGNKGISALEMRDWASRLGAYIYTLRHEYGLEIETVRETHLYGWRGRYVLHTPVEALDIVME